MANRIRTGDPCGFNERRSSMFRVGSWVRQTPEEGRRTYWPKRCGNNNKDEDTRPKTIWRIMLCFFVYRDYICVFLCVIVYEIISVCVCMYDDTGTWHIWGCFMIICVAMCSKRWRESRNGFRFGRIKFLLCILMIFAKRQSYIYICI